MGEDVDVAGQEDQEEQNLGPVGHCFQYCTGRRVQYDQRYA